MIAKLVGLPAVAALAALVNIAPAHALYPESVRECGNLPGEGFYAPAEPNQAPDTLEGVWKYGAWDGVRCVVLIIKRWSSGALVHEGWGSFAPWGNRNGWATAFEVVFIDKNTLEYVLGPNGSTRRLVLSNGILNAKILHRSGRFNVAHLAKVPEKAVWNKTTAGNCHGVGKPRIASSKTAVEEETDPKYLRFAGVWRGNWQATGGKPGICAALTVTSVTSVRKDGSVSGTYSWGSFRGIRSGSVRFNGKVERDRFGDVLKFGTPKGPNFTFWFRDGLLEGKYESRNGESWSLGVFGKVKAEQIVGDRPEKSTDAQETGLEEALSSRPFPRKRTDR